MFNQKGVVGILVLIVVLAVGAAGVYWWQYQEIEKQRQKLERRIEGISQVLQDLKKKIKKPAETESQSGEGEVTITSPRRTIKVTEPQTGAAIKSPVKIAGRASVFEANVQLRVKDATGKVLGEGFATALEAAPKWGKFEQELEFEAAEKAQVGTVELYTEDAATGEVSDLATIPVLLRAK